MHSLIVSDVSIHTSPPILLDEQEWEAALFALTDKIAEEEDIPIELAYRYAAQRLAMLQGGQHATSRHG